VGETRDFVPGSSVGNLKLSNVRFENRSPYKCMRTGEDHRREISNALAKLLKAQPVPTFIAAGLQAFSERHF